MNTASPFSLEKEMFKNRGYNDKLYFLNFVCTWFYTYLCLLLSVFGPKIGIEDYSFITLGLPLVWADFGLHTGFIVNKAKVENLKKNIPPDKVNWNGNIDI